MGYTYDSEKEKLRNYALSKKNEYKGPTEEINIIEIIFDEKTRKCQIIYKIKKGKRTIDKRFTYMGEQYKIYSTWQYSTTEKTKKITLTDNAIENLPNLAKEDSIIALSLSAIYKALPDHLIPMSVRINEVKKKYFDMRKAAEKAIIDSYDISALTLKMSKLTNEKRETEEKIRLNDSSCYCYDSEIKKLTEKIDKHRNSLFSFIFYFSDKKAENLIERNKDRVKEISSETNQKKTLIFELETEINALNSEISISVQARDYELEKKCAELDLSMEKELEALNNITFTPSSITEPVSKRGVPTKEWIKEERNKIGRIYKDGLTLRDFILKRDNYTCQQCGNSVEKEPNLLLEVDHIQPVSKWGPSVPDNLETLCWKCNRSKSNK